MGIKTSTYDKEFEEYITSRLACDTNTGVLTWKPIEAKDRADAMYNGKYAGKQAGTVKKNSSRKGYRDLFIKGRSVCAHRLVWWFHYGVWPEKTLDHINQDRDDNRITNLREVDTETQSRNRGRNKLNTSGVTGVHYDDRIGKWVSRINAGGVRVLLGSFEDFFDAVCARRSAELKYGYSSIHGRDYSTYA